MFMLRRTVYWGTLVALFTLGCAVAPARAMGQAKGFLTLPAMNAKLDTLELLVVSSDSCNRRRSTLIAIGGAGWMRNEADAPPPPPYPGIVARLARIYRQTTDCSLRATVITLMIQQAEREEAVAFLALVAQEPAPALPQPTPPGVVLGDDNPPVQTLAIGALSSMDQPGEAALRRLQAEGTVREPMAREELERLARRGFQKPKD